MISYNYYSKIYYGFKDGSDLILDVAPILKCYILTKTD
jgi:hypothetical protein